MQKYKDMIFINMEKKNPLINLASDYKPKEKYGQKWYPYIDKKDSLPEQLINLSYNCATHGSLISSKIDDLCGLGLTSDNKRTRDYLLKANKYGESWNKLYRKLASDLVVFGGYAEDLQFSKNHKTIENIYHVPFFKLRIGDVDGYGNITSLYYGNKFKGYLESDKPIERSVYSLDNKEPTQINYEGIYSWGNCVYPLPSYYPCLDDIRIAYEISEFQLAMTQNGMYPSMMITLLNGDPGEDKQEKIYDDFQARLRGTNNAGSWLINFANSKDEAPIITPLTQPKMADLFDTIDKRSQQNILTGHKVISPMLAGVKTEGQLGGATELMNAYQIQMNRTIEPMKEILLSTINKILEFNGYKEATIIDNSPVKFTFSENILTQILTEDELRNMIGFDPKEPTQAQNNIQ